LNKSTRKNEARSDSLKAYSHKDPDAKILIEKMSKYARQAEAMHMPYWIIAQEADPIGIVAIGKEPIQLLAPPGTPVALVNLADFKQSAKNIKTFIYEAVKLAAQNNVGYILATFPRDQDEAIKQFENASFKEFDDCYQMTCQFDKPHTPLTDLQFTRVKIEEMRQFINTATEFLRDCPDITLTEALKYMPMLPDDFLSFYYNLEEFYFANKDGTIVGILDINTSQGLISNIGVDPKQRGKGYGKQIMQFGLFRLKEEGCKQARLRVHVNNTPAIHLYESLGFVKAARYKRLIWRSQQANK